MKHYQPDPPLFNGQDLTEVLEKRLVDARILVEEWGEDIVERRTQSDLMADLRERFTPIVPSLLREQIEALPPARELQQSPHSYSPTFGNAHVLTVRRFIVPVQGDLDVFTYRPSRSFLTPTTGTVRELHTGAELIVAVATVNSTQDAKAVDAALNAALSKVEQQLEWVIADLQSFHPRLTQVADQIATRKAEISHSRAVDADLRYPIRRRADAPTYAVPIQRKPLPSRSATESTATPPPEPTLSQAAYEDALNVLKNGRNALERSPSMTAKLSEELIRDLLLLLLNAQFEGGAVGEVFNGAGKTDILIRERDRNVFIAECKIWRGPKTIADALDQLLSYLVWRDTKAALLLFIRGGTPSDVTTRALAAIESYPNYKSTVRRFDEDAERADFILHANNDASRDIHLALLPFVLPPKDSR